MSKHKAPHDHVAKQEDTIVIHPVLKAKNDSIFPPIDPYMRLEEAKSLVCAIDLNVIHSEVINLKKTKPATLFGSGFVESLRIIIESNKCSVVFIDGSLTPIQQRNLEKVWNTKVMDRTGLILEIFGRRAKTSEGSLQVELAALTYQKSRLVRTWTHLERQKGGLGFIGGPGEKQIEMDRRLISERITKLKHELEQVKRTRMLHRNARRKVPFPVVALVGYTNAGKSTLFNKITKADVFAQDLLFATLDPTMRKVKLPSGREIILSDTVGFISDLPTSLIAAFRATLEEVLEANILVHVRDLSNQQAEQQKREVEKVLIEMGLETVIAEGSMIEALNKADKYESMESSSILALESNQVMTSALTGTGINDLLRLIDEQITENDTDVDIVISYEKAQYLGWVYQNCQVLSREDKDGGIYMKIRVPYHKIETLNNYQLY